MTRQSTPRLFDIRIAHEAHREFDLLPPREARAVAHFMRTTLREHPEKHGVRLRGALKDRLLAKKSNFQIIYRIDHVTRTVYILRIQAQ